MHVLLKSVLAVVIGVAVFAGGALAVMAIDASNREALAVSTISVAREHLQKGSRAEAIYLAGSAVALSSKPFVLLSAGDLLQESNEPNIAKNVLTKAMNAAIEEDPKLKIAIAASLDRVAASISKGSKL
jgi:hypothetical protein